MEAVKEQILIRYLGLGWVDAHHPWSKNNNTYTSEVLFQHLIKVVIPLAKKLKVRTEPILDIPNLPYMIELGTKSALAEDHEQESNKRWIKTKMDVMAELKAREERGEGYCWSDKQ